MANVLGKHHFVFDTTAKERKNHMCENISDYTSLNILTLGSEASMSVNSY